MSDTPRTDDRQYSIEMGLEKIDVFAFARELERENAQLEKHLNQWREAAELYYGAHKSGYVWDYDKAVDAYEKLKQEGK